MKSYEQLRKEAEIVLEAVGELIKDKGVDNLHTADELSALSSLVDSYARLYEEIQK